MRRAALGVIGLTATLVLGFAVAALAQSGGSGSLLAETGEATSEETNESTTESAKPTRWKAALTTGAEVPKPKGVKPGAVGTFTVTVTTKGASYSAAYKLSFRNLTGKAVAAHVHRGKPGKAGPVLFALCGPCTSGKGGTASISKAAVTAMMSGAAYVNVHTARNASGEIRGQIRKAG